MNKNIVVIIVTGGKVAVASYSLHLHLHLHFPGAVCLMLAPWFLFKSPTHHTASMYVSLKDAKLQLHQI